MTWQLRRAQVGDLDAIMALEKSIFENDAWSAAMMARDVADPACYYLVAFPPEEPDRIEAYAGLLASPGSAESDIQTIAVAESARGQGLGRLLVRSLVTEARKRGARLLFLEVRADNPSAQRLYARLGFEDIGVRRGYYQPDNVDAIMMRLNIPETESMLTPEAATTEAATTDLTTTDLTTAETAAAPGEVQS